MNAFPLFKMHSCNVFHLLLFTALDDLDNKRDELYQKVKEAIEAYKTEVIKNQQKYLKEAQEKKDDIETRKAVMMECFKETDLFMNNENPIDIIHNSKDILLSVEESVKVGKGKKSFQSYKTKLFKPIIHNIFPEQVIGKLVTEKKMINMSGIAIWKMHPVRPICKMPVKGTLVKSWKTQSAGLSVAGGVEGDIYTATYGTCNDQGLFPYYLETFDEEGYQKLFVTIEQYYYVKGLVSARINDMDMIVLSTYNPPSIQIRKSHDGKLIDSLPLAFEPAYNTICMTPDNNILVCSDNGKVIECHVQNLKLVQTGKTLNLHNTDVRGLCHVTHDNLQLVIATSCTAYHQQITAVDYHTSAVVWKKNKPLCEGKPISPMAITHDGAGHLFVSDFENRRIFIMTPDGGIHHSMLQNTNADYFYHLAWLHDRKRLVVKDEKRGLYLYDISYEQD